MEVRVEVANDRVVGGDSGRQFICMFLCGGRKFFCRERGKFVRFQKCVVGVLTEQCASKFLGRDPRHLPNTRTYENKRSAAHIQTVIVVEA